MLGISVYPTKAPTEESIAYLKLAAHYGFKRVFASLLDVTPENKDAILAQFKTVFTVANELGMYVTIDANPRLFDTLGIDYHHLGLFKDLGASAIRLDANFDGLTESMMSYEDSGLDIELNLSVDTGNIGNIMSYLPNKQRLSGCHNFYPQRFTGLDLDFFTKCTEKYRQMGLKTAAFVTSQVATTGPHPFNDGLPTLEIHRDLPIVVQAKHLFATGLIDDVLISNQFASEAELQQLSQLNQSQLSLAVDFEPTATPLEKEILLAHQHFNRGDVNSYSVRSTFVKLQYKDQSIPVNHAGAALQPGDVVIGNDSFGQYKGEVNIVKQPMPNIDQHKNVVGHLVPDEQFLIPYIQPWMKFRFEDAHPIQ
ncbi:DUF871 domain-containing protein [Lactiplantibacillus mudanjiangensis]|uniref:Outer surface protein [Lactobacillus allii] n=1 Tax=Lactiplantibacillus mudanjiangensis TaxID=1296538 RepID=A0A660E1J2_9LACO|nr:MupG family TIM beta-alpha barrel fold protein [Lactiplantibacillus mudanjiangensis]VDG22790.1 outer surface protein [Lactobacillus allii] [Lactiplantibacillus mudanjiangensis]VDG26640.1 outer surface protein [Lactobacillus allii] [Lactiplantibacillus mudanjiangensis]